MMIDTEQYSFQLILHSGNARSTAYEALQLVKSNAFKEGEKKAEHSERRNGGGTKAPCEAAAHHG